MGLLPARHEVALACDEIFLGMIDRQPVSLPEVPLLAFSLGPVGSRA